MFYYAGIGARITPQEYLDLFKEIGKDLGNVGYTLRSGGADGADKAFELGADNSDTKPEIYLPWSGFNHSTSKYNPTEYPYSEEEMLFTSRIHPKWSNCTPSTRKLHYRNTRVIIGCPQIHGERLQMSRFVICWTERGITKGGTAQAIRLAQYLKIPIFNFGMCKNAKETDALMGQIINKIQIIKEGAK